VSDLAAIAADLDRLVKARAAIDLEIDAAVHRLRALTSAPVAASEPVVAVIDEDVFPADRLRPGQAERIFGIHRSILYRIGVAQLGVAGGCSARDRKGRLIFSQSRLERYFEANPHRPRNRS
jgi:hypothetical protein